MERKTTRGLLALLFAFVVACTVSCATPAGRTTGTVVDDATITARVKTALLADKDVSGVAVSVDTFKGEVVLNGAVSTQAQIDKAESLARGVSGVKSVKNLIRIKEPTGDASLPSRRGAHGKGRGGESHPFFVESLGTGHQWPSPLVGTRGAARCGFTPRPWWSCPAVRAG